MSEPINNGGPAFPGFQYTEGHGPFRKNAADEWERYDTGMTLRDYFAAKALAGLSTRSDEYTSRRWTDEMANHAYEIADAMLRSRTTK